MSDIVDTRVTVGGGGGGGEESSISLLYKRGDLDFDGLSTPIVSTIPLSTP